MIEFELFKDFLKQVNGRKIIAKKMYKFYKDKGDCVELENFFKGKAKSLAYTEMNIKDIINDIEFDIEFGDGKGEDEL